MSRKTQEYVAVFVGVLFGGGAFALYLSVPAFMSGGSWAEAVRASLPLLAMVIATLATATWLRRRRMRGLYPFQRDCAPDGRLWVLRVFYWLTLAPIVFLIVQSLLVYPFAIVSTMIWPGTKPWPAVAAGWLSLLVGTLAGLSAPWLIWRHLRASHAAQQGAAADEPQRVPIER